MNATLTATNAPATTTGTLPTHGSRWLKHFETNRAKPLRIDWSAGSALSLARDARLIRSIQSWQLGESSDGAHLLLATDAFLASRAQADPAYREAIVLFIKEEQKHGNHLGNYLELAGASRLTFDLGDYLFRKVRYFFGSMELWTSSVFMVESMAEIYYKALADSGRCPLLTQICQDILRDEAYHIQFQLERLRIQDREMFLPMRWFYGLFSRALFLNIVGSIWLLHGIALRAGGLTFRSYWRKSWKKFRRW